MYAVVEIAGQQFKVARGQKVYVHRLEANEVSLLLTELKWLPQL
jgi:large subunit ribosomal protein L21